MRAERTKVIVFDLIEDFDLGTNQIAVGSAFLADDLDPAFDLTTLLEAANAGQSNDGLPSASLATGWKVIAQFEPWVEPGVGDGGSFDVAA